MSEFLVIVGATGTGKSALSLDVAQALGAMGVTAEIVNADAMQLYRGMDVGTAKLPPAERRGIPHHLLDVLDPTQEASVADYQVRARAAIEEITARGALPILVGGSGLYVSSVLYDFQFPQTDPAVRARLERELLEQGPGALAERLRRVDPVAAASIGAHNGRRIVRALEVVELTGGPFGAGLPESREHWRAATVVMLETERSVLVDRLDRRAADMWRDGILDEAESLRDHGLGVTASRAIGYAQAFAQLSGEYGQDRAIEETAALTRRYARRQVSWFRRYSEAHRLAADDPDRLSNVLALMRQD